MYEIFFTAKDSAYAKLNELLSMRIGDGFKILKTVNGKPYIENTPLFFSISHSGEKAVIVISDKQVGVDCEVIRERNYSALLRRFSSKERNEINGLNDFLMHWVVREAYIKMLGATLAEKLNKLKFTDGTLFENDIPVECELVNGVSDGLIYCVCIDK